MSPKEALLLVDPEALSQLLSPGFDPAEWAKVPILAKGLPASPGAASGQVVFTADDAVEWTRQGKQVILVRKETVPDDIHGMFVAQGMLTAMAADCTRPLSAGRWSSRRSRSPFSDDLEKDKHSPSTQGCQGSRVRLVRLPEGEIKPENGVEAERDSSGCQRTARSEEIGHLPALQQDYEWADKVPAGHPANADLRIRRSSHTHSGRAASASAGPSTCSSARIDCQSSSA